MKCMIRYAVFLALITLAPNRSSAQASDIIGGIAGALLNAAVNAPRNTATPAPAQPARQSAQPTRQPARPRQTTSTSAPTTKKPRSSAKSAPADPDVDSVRRFDGTWLATRSKVSPEGEEISQIFTIVVKNGKATKTLDATNKSTPDNPLYESSHELRRKWTYSSTDFVAQGSSLTVQWSAGQLSDWTPGIPSDVVQNYGNPSSETSVYTLKGDELTRINDPNGISYRRVK
jgi:hypothetical protein